MSIILDALNRSDTDREEEREVPGLHTMHGPRDSGAGPAWKTLLWPALALSFALLAAFAWWSGQHRPAEIVAPAPTLPPVEPPATPGKAEVVTPVMTAAQPLAADPDPATRADVAALYAAAEEPAKSEPAPAPAQVTPPKPSEAPVSAARSEPAMDVDALARAARAELADLQAESEPVVEHSAPFVTELRQSQKDQIPSIFYRAHNWASNPAERSVVLNKQEYREGQQVKPGLRLVEILEDSIVLDFQGTEFRLRSLNSWVNL